MSETRSVIPLIGDHGINIMLRFFLIIPNTPSLVTESDQGKMPVIE